MTLPLPTVPKLIRQISQVRFRYYMNVCTVSYSMAVSAQCVQGRGAGGVCCLCVCLRARVCVCVCARTCVCVLRRSMWR